MRVMTLALLVILAVSPIVSISEANEKPPSWAVRVLCHDDHNDKVIDSRGSGCYICPGYVITNEHVIEDAKEVWVRFPDWVQVRAKIVKKDDKIDLALLKLEDPNDELTYKVPVPVAKRTYTGDRGTVQGYGQGLWGAGKGYIRHFYNKSKDEDARPYLWLVGYAARPGDSGGGITNHRGHLIGITWGSDQTTLGTGGIRIEAVREFTKGFIKWKQDN